MKYTATVRCMPPPEAAGAEYYAMTPDEEFKAPAASRPAPVEEVRPQEHGVRHCGSGYELVLDATVPQMGKEFDVPNKLSAGLQGRLRAFMQTLDPGEGGGGQVIAQEIPEVQVPRRRRVQPQERISERIQEQVVDARESRSIPQKRISERVMELTVERDIPQERTSERFPKHIVGGSPQERISERIVQQTVNDPVPQVIPQKRTSERIVEQKVVDSAQSIPQERLSERIAGQIVDGGPGAAGTGTSRSSAAALGDAECPKHGVLRTFPRKKKSATSGPESSAGVLGQSSSWTRAAYELEQSSPEEEEDPDVWIDEHGRGWWRTDTAPGRWYLVGSNKTIFWDAPE